MKIIRLKVENIKKIKAVEIVAQDNNFIEITGKNAQGKSSIMDSIAMALGGKALIPSEPIRHGEKYGLIEVNIGDFTVRRLFNADGSTIKITNKDGSSKNSPQKFLDEIVGSLSFDPVSFMNMEPKKQAEIFKNLAGINTDDLDADYKLLYEKRHKAGIELKMCESRFDAVKEYCDDIDVPDISILQDMRNIAQESNNKLARFNIDKDAAMTRIDYLNQQIREEKEIYLNLENEINKTGVIDISVIDENIKNIHPLIIKKQKHEEYIKEYTALSHAKELHSILDGSITSNINNRKKILESAMFPVDGLDLNNGELYYNGIPFDQLSQAERLKVSVSMAIAEKPQLKIVRILDGALLDNASLSLLKEMAEKHDIQIWIETVSKNGEQNADALYIEDGEIL